VRATRENGRDVWLPSFQLLAGLWAAGKEERGNNFALMDKLNSTASCMKTKTGGAKKTLCPSLELWPGEERKIELKLSDDRIARRIRYAIPNYQSGMIQIKTVSTDKLKTGNKSRPLLWRISAKDALNSQNSKTALEEMKGRIVFIGGSFKEGRDLYPTPLKHSEMPGVLVIINALQSLLEQGEMAIAPLWQRLFAIAAFVFFAGCFFVKWGSLGIRLVCMTILILYVVFVPLSALLLKHGLWLDFALPPAAVGLFRSAVGIHKYGLDLRKWRARRVEHSSA